MLIDQNGDGVYERSIDFGNKLTGSDLAVPWWSNSWWIFALVGTISVIAVGAIYAKMRSIGKKAKTNGPKTGELQECIKYLVEKQGLEKASAANYCRMLGKRWREITE